MACGNFVGSRGMSGVRQFCWRQRHEWRVAILLLVGVVVVADVAEVVDGVDGCDFG